MPAEKESGRASRHAEIRRRMEIAFDLADTAEQMMRQNLRRRNPDATDAEIEAGVREWLHKRPGAEHGDGVGRPVPLERVGSGRR
jgi:Rv0078B-related antitoxin